MNNIIKKSLFWECILLSILLLSCVPKKKYILNLVIVHSQQQIVVGNYQKALNYYIVACKEYPDDEILQDNYLKTVKRIKQIGDIALQEDDFVLAEEIYYVLWKNYSHFHNFDRSLSFTIKSLSNSLRNCRINLSERRARQYLDRDEYEKAINTYMVFYRKYPNDRVFLTNLNNIILDMKFLAEIALSKEDFLSAGRIYYSLLKNHKSFNMFYESLSLPIEFLNEEIKNCRLQLTKKGLEQYRKGNLVAAIAIWEGILRFDPDNQQIKKAVETAKTQLKSLRKKEIQ